MRSSLSTTITASSVSRLTTASIAWSRAVLVSSSVESVSCSSSSSWTWKSVRISEVGLPKTTRYVVLGPLVARVREDLVRRSKFDKFAVEHECGAVRDPGGLLHVVGDDRDRVARLQLTDQLLDAER